MNQNKVKGILASIGISVVVLSSLMLFINFTSSFASASSNSPAQTDDVTITLWHAYYAGNFQETALIDMIAEFESTYPTITVELENHYPSVNLFDTIIDRIKSDGETPNITIGYPNQMWNYARFDALRLLDDLASDSNSGLDLTDFHPSSLGDNRLAEYENQLGGLPISYGAANLMFYNADILASEGITVPQTWDEFQTACISLTTGTISGTILYSHATQFIGLDWSHGGNLYSADLKQAVFNDDSGKSALQLYRDLIDDGYARMEIDRYEGQARFAEGKVAFLMGASGQFPYLRAAIDDVGVVNDWGVARLPADPGHEAVFTFGTNIMMFRSTSEKEQAAWLFLKWITEREQDARLSVQMEHYPVRISSSTHPSVTEKIASDLQYAQTFNVMSTFGKNQIVLAGLIEILGELTNAMDEVLYNNQPVTDTLDNAVNNVNGILALTGPDSATIPPDGGTLVYTNTQGLVSITEFPPGALAVTTTVAYVPVNDLPSEDLAFALIPNMTFDKPVTITINYRDEDVIGMDESQLRLYNYNWANNSWGEANPCGGYLRDVENNELTAFVCHFSDHALVDWLFHNHLPVILKEHDS